MAEDMTTAMFDNIINSPLPNVNGGGGDPPGDSQEAMYALRARNEQLEAELASARSEIEFAGLKEEELEKRNNLAQGTIKDLTAQVEALKAQLVAAGEADKGRRPLTFQADDGSRKSLDAECAELRSKVSQLESELSSAQRDLFESKQFQSTQATTELPSEGSSETAMLQAAYQQISVLNTQLAHLYTELTIARTDAQKSLPSRSDPGSQQDTNSAELQRQAQQIADLVSDIRHLQLDLEYHQQKLDQMVEEKQNMLKSMRQTQKDLGEARQLIEERDQMLKHKDVDIQHLRHELKEHGGGGPGSADESALAALRAEAAAKDSALIVSHYELHKEKLMRDRLEQKNFKLMERMQKLMMVVETMRKNNVGLEKSLEDKERAHEESELKLRQVAQKAKHYQKQVKQQKSTPRGKPSLTGGTHYELEGGPSLHALPPLSNTQRSNGSGGKRSGASTPRTPR